jgi:ATP-dependent DNA helicase 2 subunit 2
MAEKEATVFLIDMGRPMGAQHQGRSQNDLDWSMQYVWDRIMPKASSLQDTVN